MSKEEVHGIIRNDGVIYDLKYIIDPNLVDIRL